MKLLEIKFVFWHENQRAGRSQKHRRNRKFDFFCLRSNFISLVNTKTYILLLVFIRWNKNRPYTEEIKYPLYVYILIPNSQSFENNLPLGSVLSWHLVILLMRFWKRRWKKNTKKHGVEYILHLYCWQILSYIVPVNVLNVLGTYHIGVQRRRRQACTSGQSRQSLRCLHTWSSEVDKGSD